MNNTILISKNEIGDIKIAFLENYKLYNFEIENENNKFKKGNIIKGFITKAEASLDAFFIDYGATKDGFLSFKEISKDYLEVFKMYDGVEAVKKKNTSALCKSFIIQIEKEEAENKGATLTTYLHIAGFFIVLAPYSSELKGISKKILKNTRFELKKVLNNTKLLKNVGIILRTFGYGKDTNEFRSEIFLLLSQLKLIKTLYNNEFVTDLIYECNNIIIRIIRDYIKFDVTEVIVDNVYLFNSIYKYLSITKSKILSKITLHNNRKNLFEEYNLLNQIEILFNREIFLTSGGSITIDTSEALTFIDVNSSKSNKCDDVTETALQTNLEAVVEIFKQLKIRDLSGLIIVDFIDVDEENFSLLEYKLKELINTDKAKIQIEKISKFGLLEISREKIKTTEDDPENIMCFKCQGNGKLQNINLICLNLLDSITQEINKDNIKQINIELSPKLANYLINVKRNEIQGIEKKNNVKIIIIINEYLDKNDYKIYTYKKYKTIKLNDNIKEIKLNTDYFIQKKQYKYKKNKIRKIK